MKSKNDLKNTIESIQLTKKMTSPISEMQKQFEEQYKISGISNVIESIQSSIQLTKKMTSPISEMQKQFEEQYKISGISNVIESIQSSIQLTKKMASPISEMQKQFEEQYKISGISSTLELINDNFKTFESLSNIVNSKFENESILYEQINGIQDDLTINESIDLLLNSDIQDKNEKNIIDDSFQILCEMSTDFNILKSSITSTKYKRVVIVIFWLFVLNSFHIYSFYNQLSNNDIHYQSNCNNLRVRSTPTSKDNTNIITKINKNVYVEKIGSKNKWINVRFEYADGVEKEGWIYRTKLTKIND